MINNTTPQVHFGANFIKHVEIKKYDKLANNFKPVKASFVEFDPNNKNDLEAMKAAVDTWKGKFLAGSIVDHAAKMQNGELSQKHSQIYLLSEQNQNHDKLNPSQILGMAKMERWSDSPDELRYFETKPDIKYGTEKRTFKNVGEAMFNSLKELYPKAIELTSSYSATGFYEKQGLKLIDEGCQRYRWEG